MTSLINDMRIQATA